MNEGNAPDKSAELFRTPGFAWRVGISIFVVFGWLAFVIIWLFFYAGDLSIWKNIAVFLVSIIVGIGILAGVWATWGIRYASQLGGQEMQFTKPKGTWILNSVAGVGWLVFLIVWLFFYASEYDAYQNLAIVITSLLVLGAVTGSAWVVRWLRASRR